MDFEVLQMHVALSLHVAVLQSLPGSITPLRVFLLRLLWPVLPVKSCSSVLVLSFPFLLLLRPHVDDECDLEPADSVLCRVQ